MKLSWIKIILLIFCSLIGLLNIFDSCLLSNLFIFYNFKFSFLIITFSGILDYIFPLIQFPKPTGKFSVGRKTFHLEDTSRKEIHCAKKDSFRELILNIWYPAKLKKEVDSSLYMPNVIQHALKDVSKRTKVPFSIFSKFVNLKTFSFENAAIFDDQNSFPVIIFSHGLGGVCELYTAYIEELVSHGYIVVGVDHTYSSYVCNFPDGRTISLDDKFRVTISSMLRNNAQEKISLIQNELETWVSDTEFVLNQVEEINEKNEFFKSKFNLNELGILGHSLGGALSAEMCRRNSRFKAGISLDGGVIEDTAKIGFEKPFMFIVGVLLGHNLYPSEERLKSLKIDKNVWDSLIGKYRNYVHGLCQIIGKNAYYITIDQAGHFSFTDISLICPLIKKRLTFDIGSGPSSEITRITNEHILQFFNKHLTNQNNTLSSGFSLKNNYFSKFIQKTD